MAVLIERVAAVLRSGWFMVGGLAAGALVGWRRAEDWPLLWASVGAVVGSLVVCLIGGIVLGLLGAIAEGRAAFRLLDRDCRSSLFNFWWGHLLLPATVGAVVVGLIVSPNVLWGLVLVPSAVGIGWASWLAVGVMVSDRLDRPGRHIAG